MTVAAARAQLVNLTIPYYREGVGLLLTKEIEVIAIGPKQPG